METVRIAVVGAGVVGLSTALCISRMVPRCSVTVISDKFTPHTTSDVAAGMLIPHAYPDIPMPRQKQWFRETFDHLFAIASSAEAGDAGVHLVSGWQIFQSIPAEEVPFWADVVLGFRKMSEAELKKFPQHVFGQAFTTLKCEGPSYLPWLEKRHSFLLTGLLMGYPIMTGYHHHTVTGWWHSEDAGFLGTLEFPPGIRQPFTAIIKEASRIRESGGLVLTRQIEDLWELHPAFDVVVNCAGLGSRQLAGDWQVVPIRGQVLQVQAPWVKHFVRDGNGLTYIYPGTSTVTLGGSRQKGDWNLCPDAEMSRAIFSRCCALEPSLYAARDIREKVGLRPCRPGVRLQRELLIRGDQRLPVVHHYGHGGGGISVHWGCALEATRLVEECVQALRPSASKSKL